MAVELQVDRAVLAVPHTDLRLPDGRRLRRFLPDDFRRRAAGGDSGILDFEGWYGPKQLIVLCTLDDTRHGRLLHVSVSYQTRDPTWADLKILRALFFPADQDAMMVMPRAADYVAGVAPILGQRGAPGGADSYVFHLWQLPVTWGMQ